MPGWCAVLPAVECGPRIAILSRLLILAAMLTVSPGGAAAVEIPLPAVSAFGATAGDATVTLTWAVPEIDTGGSSHAVMLRRSTSGYPTSAADGTEVAFAVAPPYLDADVDNGATYFYAAFLMPLAAASPVLSPDTSWVESPPAFARATPMVGRNDEEAPQLVWGPFAIGGSCVADCATAAAALLTWELNEPAAATINYGTTTAYGKSREAPGIATHYRFLLADLIPGSVHHYQVCATDPRGNRACSADGAFLAPAAPGSDTVTLGVRYVNGHTDTTAVLNWFTSAPTTAEVSYGATEQLDRAIRYTAYDTYHRVELSGLAPSTTYHFRLGGTSPEGAAVTSPDYTLRTLASPDAGSPAALEVICDSYTVSTEEALLGLLSDEPTTLAVGYNRLTNPWPQDRRAVDLLPRRRHRMLLPDLEAGETYRFSLSVTDRWGTSGNDTSRTCATLSAPPLQPTRVLEGPVVDARRAGQSWAVVSWRTDRPTDSRLWYAVEPVTARPGVAERRGGFEIKAAMFERQVGWRRAHSVLLTGLQPATHYRVRAGGVDLFGTEVESDDVIFSTWPATTTPSPCYFDGGAVRYVSPDTAVIQWEHCQPLQSEAALAVTSSPAASPQAARTPAVARHVWDFTWPMEDPGTRLRAVVTGLVPDTEYTFEIHSWSSDGASITSRPADPTFTTPLLTDAAPPVVADLTGVAAANTVVHLAWGVSEPAAAVVRFGDTSELGSELAEPEFSTAFSLRLSGLEPGSTFHYAIDVTDAAGNAAAGAATGQIPLPVDPDVTGPVITADPVASLLGGAVVVSWETDEPADSHVWCGTDPNNLDLYVQDGVDNVGHEIRLYGLVAGETYECEVQSIDIEGNLSARRAVGTLPGLPVPVRNWPVLLGVAAAISGLMLSAALRRWRGTAVAGRRR
ncbi:MAG: fibronectin type III domain-containing protein [Candidatus Schekmanbacteria bacterium]|nr:fibronectin type III domain-containing protein [Candidatus Schekmanbacteria bacterium]